MLILPAMRDFVILRPRWIIPLPRTGDAERGHLEAADLAMRPGTNDQK
jgi:hypothetical protein